LRAIVSSLFYGKRACLRAVRGWHCHCYSSGMNTSNVLFSGTSVFDEIDVNNTYVSQSSKETKIEQGSLKSFKEELEKQDAKVSGSESSSDINDETKEIKKSKRDKTPESEKEAPTASNSSKEQSANSKETESELSSPVFIPIITDLTTSETGSKNSPVSVNAWFQGLATSATPGLEENTAYGNGGYVDKINIKNNSPRVSPNLLIQISPADDIPGGSTGKPGLPTLGTPLTNAPIISSPKGTKEGINPAEKAAGVNKNETLNISNLLIPSKTEQQSALTKEERQQAAVFRGENSLELLRAGHESASIVAKVSQGEGELKPVNTLGKLSIQTTEGERPQGEGTKPIDARQVQLSTAFAQGETGGMLDDSEGGNTGDESKLSLLKTAAHGGKTGAEHQVNASTVETSRIDAKQPQPIHEVSTKIIEQVREPMIQALKKGVDHIQLRLKPDGLGELRIDLRVQSGRLNMQIITDNFTTRQALEFGLPDLKGQLSDSGISVGNTNIEYDDGKGGDKNHEGQKDGQAHDKSNKKKENQSFREYFA